MPDPRHSLSQQITPNVSRLLIPWGVDKIIGDNLVECDEVHLRRTDGTKVGYAKAGTSIRQYVTLLVKFPSMLTAVGLLVSPGGKVGRVVNYGSVTEGVQFIECICMMVLQRLPGEKVLRS